MLILPTKPVSYLRRGLEGTFKSRDKDGCAFRLSAVRRLINCPPE